jgi:WD40 repeat protein/DNA-binding SARP family transcriptional activator
MPSSPGASSVEFRVLGPVAAVRNGEPIPIGGARQRALLAALIIHANQVVSQSRLIDELFGEEHTHASVNRLQVGISRLRSALNSGEDNGHDTILVTQPGGYMLAARPDQIDAVVFERLSAEGHTALGQGAPERAHELLTTALALWRGEAFCDLAFEDVATTEIRRLQDLRLTALIDRMDADLALGRAAELVGELEHLVEEYPSQERLVGQLMLALYRSGRQTDALEAYRSRRAAMRGDLGLDPGPALRELERGILRHDATIVGEGETRAAGPRVTICPYKGLAGYELTDAEYFCGRDTLVDQVVSRVASSRLVGIVGASGMGKSSLLRAGLLPRLAEGALPASESWQYVVFRPGRHPAEALASALARSTGGGPALVCIDQFEEVFTVCDDEGEQRRFLADVVDLSSAAGSDTRVVLTLRADHYGRCALEEPFARRLSGNHILVVPMTRADMLSAVQIPAARVGLELEPGLAEQLVDDAGDEPGSLPLLSAALLELWAAREGDRLTLEGYRKVRGVHGAIARLAERAYAQLNPDEQRAAHQMLLRLVSGEDEVVRRRAPRVELDLDADSDAAQALAVLASWRLLTVSDDTVEVSHEALLQEWPRLDAWLDEDRDGRKLREHLANAAQEWHRNRRDPAELYRGARLAAAMDWAESHPRELNRVERQFLTQSRDAADREVLIERRHNRRLQGLLAAAVVLLVAAVAAGVVAAVQRSHAQHSAAAAQRSATVALAQSLGAQSVTQTQIGRALLLGVEATRLSRSAVTQGDLLSTTLRSPDLLASYYTPPGIRPNAIAVSPDGSKLTVTEYDGNQLLMFSTSTRRLIRPVAAPGYDASDAYTPDGRELGVVIDDFADKTTNDGLYLYSAATGKLERRLPMPAAYDVPSSVRPYPANRSLLFTDHGRYAWSTLVGGRGGYLVRWDLRTGASVTRHYAATDGYPVLASANGRLIAATTADGRVETFRNASTLRVVRQLPLHGVLALALSPDGRTLAEGSASGAVMLVDVATGAAKRLPNGHTSQVDGAVFTSSGSELVTAGEDNRVIVWSLAGDTLLRTDLGHSAGAQGLVIDARHDIVYSSALDGSVLAYDLTGNQAYGRVLHVAPIPATNTFPSIATPAKGGSLAVSVGAGRVELFGGAEPPSHRFVVPFPDGRAPGNMAFSPDGQELAVGGGITADGTLVPGAELVDTSGSPRRLRTLRGFPSGPGTWFSTIAFTPNGRDIVWSDLYGNGLRQGDLGITDATGRRIGPLRTQRVGTYAAVVSPDGRRLLTIDMDSGLHVYSFPRLRALASSDAIAASNLEALAVSPGGKMLAVGDYRGLVHLLDATTLRPLEPPILVASGPVYSLSFDGSGQLLAASGSDAATDLIDVPDWREFDSPLPEPVSYSSSAVSSVFGPGDTLYTVSLGGAATVWPLSVASLTRHACSVAHRQLTHTEWDEFLRGRPYQRQCPAPG